MIVIVDDRELVREGFKSMFARLGYPAEGVAKSELANWLDSIGPDEVKGIHAFLTGNFHENEGAAQCIKKRSKAPLIAMLDHSNLNDVLYHFENGADDVVKKPIHATEILARAAAIRRRNQPATSNYQLGRLKVFADGRDPQIDDETFVLPRRERRILEYLASIGDRRATRSQIYNAVYGVLEQNVDECVIESHISKLRKKLKAALGHDIIDSKRFLGYRLFLDEQLADEDIDDALSPNAQITDQARFGQALTANL